MPRGPTNQELWDSLKNATGCSDGCLSLIIWLILIVGFIIAIFR